MRVGITGHQVLPDAKMWDWVSRKIKAVLSDMPSPAIGVTSLAAGADQVFARSVLEMGGQIEVVVPFAGYERTFEHEADRVRFVDLSSNAREVIVLEGNDSDEESFLAAGRLVVGRSDVIVAVWDGKPAKGVGGTADVVRHARKVGKRIVRIDPIARLVAWNHAAN